MPRLEVLALMLSRYEFKTTTASLVRTPEDPRMWMVSRIDTDEADRGKGQASILLKGICSEADAEEIGLIGFVAADDGLEEKALLDWYGRNGFQLVWESDDLIAMFRAPRMASKPVEAPSLG
jgi:hypothetical protein